MRTIKVATRIELTNEIHLDPQSQQTVGEAIQSHLAYIQNEFGSGQIDRVTISGLRGLLISQPRTKKAI